MVGGEIVGLTTVDGKTHVNVADCPHYPKHPVSECKKPDSCCVYTDCIRPDGRIAELKIGDSIWWQSGNCYWTPKANCVAPMIQRKRGLLQGKHWDIPLRKIGYSH